MRAAKFQILSVVFGICLTTQLACGRPSPSENPTTTPSPDHSAVVDQILERHREAIGGQAAIDRVTTYKAEGTFESSLLPERGAFSAWGKEPHKTLSVIEFPRIGTLRKGFDGKNRWVETPVGTYSDETPKEMAEVERDAEVYRAGKIKDLYYRMTLEGPARLHGRDVYVVEGEPEKGPKEKLFFDRENGLLLRWDMVRRDPRRGNVFVKLHLDDYREVDGLKVPFKVRIAFESFSVTLRLDELKHNVPIADAVFEKPR
jgi:hypothetical protein